MIFNYYRNRNRRKRGQREVGDGEGENVIWGGERTTEVVEPGGIGEEAARRSATLLPLRTFFYIRLLWSILSPETEIL